ncbi:MAG: OmpA family protein [Rhodospirillales bacterium]
MRLNIAAVLLALAPFGAAAQGQLPSEVERNLLTLANGAVAVSASANAPAAIALLDGSPRGRWSNGSPKNAPPYAFVFELRAPTRLGQVGIDNAEARPGGVAGGAARRVSVEASAAGPDRGFAALGALDATPDAVALLDVAPAAPVRWLRFTVHDNHGGKGWTYLDDVIAYGEQAPVADDGRFAGIFETGRQSFIELRQAGATLTGCYTEAAGHGRGTLQGIVDNGVARLAWTADGSGVEGTALLVIDSRGQLSGVRFRQNSRSAWGGPPAKSGPAAPCGAAATSNPTAQRLAAAGAVRLYGILFDFDQATLKPQSEPVLRELAAALQSDATLKVDVEGHTDSAGDDAYNLALSARRAAAVVDWLAAHGVAAARLKPVGKGEAEPVADNATADGRALNRRVEVRRRG